MFCDGILYNAVLANLGFWFRLTWFELSGWRARLRCDKLKILCSSSEVFFCKRIMFIIYFRVEALSYKPEGRGFDPHVIKA